METTVVISLLQPPPGEERWTGWIYKPKEVLQLHLCYLLVITSLCSCLLPEVYNLFDDVMVMSEGHIIYHGERQQVR